MYGIIPWCIWCTDQCLLVTYFHIMLAAIHDILWCQSEQHDVQEQHGQHKHQNQEQQSLRHSFASTYFIELLNKSRMVRREGTLDWWFRIIRRARINIML